MLLDLFAIPHTHQAVASFIPAFRRDSSGYWQELNKFASMRQLLRNICLVGVRVMTHGHSYEYQREHSENKRLNKPYKYFQKKER